MDMSSALAVKRLQHIPNVSMTSAHEAVNRMVLAGLNTAGSFKVTVRESGGSVSALFQCQNAQRPGSHPQIARPTIIYPTGPAVRQLPIQPATTHRPTTYVTATPVQPICRFFAAGFCNRGDSCHFSHGVVQRASKAPAAVQPSLAPPAILNVAFSTQRHQRPTSAACHRPAASTEAAAAAAAATKQEALKEAEAAAAVAAAAASCGICLEKFNVSDCVQCTGGHVVCKTCFVLQIRAQTGQDVRDSFVRNGCNIICAFCKVPFRERDFISVVVDDAFQLITRARDEVAELRAENRLRAEYEARMELLRQELARGQDAHAQKVSRHRLHIAENILTLKCPRAQCGRAFLDYAGCMALTCSCGCGFCAWCLQDCGGDAHAHVLTCPRNLLPKSYGGSHDQFQTVHRERVRPLVLQYLAGVPQTEVADVSLCRNCVY